MDFWEGWTRLLWTGKRALVIGLGRSGIAAALLLQRLGVRVYANDHRPHLPQDTLTRLDWPGIEVSTGSHPRELLEPVDLVITSPGVSLDMELLREARFRGIPVWSEIELGARLWKGPMVGITGSNGKTTTTAWTGDMLNRADIKAQVAGNIGRPLAAAVLEGKRDQVLVLEVSSFQLEATVAFRPHIAAILNLAPDHLDRHGSYCAYVEAKRRILAHQERTDWAVLPAGNAEIAAMNRGARSRCFWFSRHQVPRPGVGVCHGELMLYSDQGRVSSLGGTADIGIPGWHNLENGMAAAAVSHLIGASDDSIRASLKYFPGVEHRLEWVAEVDGVWYVNDSKATNPEASRVALEAFSQPVVLLAGGRDKGTSLNQWAETVAARARVVVLLGEAAGRLRQALAREGYREVWEVPDLEQAVQQAVLVAQPGDVVLLSPACASYDQYRDFEERGNEYKDLTARLKGGGSVAQGDERT